MKLRHLRHFSEEGGVTNAAERPLHTGQPSLSRQIRDLELEIVAKLIERKARGNPACRSRDHALGVPEFQR